MKKELLIYNELCKYGSQIFSKLMKDDKNVETFKSLKSNKIADLADACFVYDTGNEGAFLPITIEIEGFYCEFKPENVFRLMASFKKLVKEAKDYIFEYEEELGELQATVQVKFDNALYAKKLSGCVSKEDIDPIMQNILLEVNTSTKDVNFVASDGRVMSIISNSVETIANKPSDNNCLQALFDVLTWGQICSLAKQNGNTVQFELHKNEGGVFSKAVAVIGNKKLYSTDHEYRYPNWHGVIIEGNDNVLLTKESQKEFKSFAKQISNKSESALGISFYRGNNQLYCEYEDKSCGVKLARTFELENTARATKCSCLNARRLAKLDFVGFNHTDPKIANVVITKQFDYMLLMPFSLGSNEDGERKYYSVPENVIKEREMMVESITA